jgi:hypothetical protein
MTTERPAPRNKFVPRFVCCIYRGQMHLFEGRDPGKKYICSPKRNRHLHLPHKYVAGLVAQGKAEWVGNGQHCAISKEESPVEWHKVLGLTGVGNARVAAMQMLRGGEQRFPRMVVGGLVSPR